MYRKYEKTYRILVPQISTKGKHYLSDSDTKKLLGGIAIYVNGTWRYNDSTKYEFNPNNLSEWKVLEI